MLGILALAAIISYVCVFIYLNILKMRNKKQKLKIAFFHPFCNDGGGGQKVLWCMLDAIFNSKKRQDIPNIAIYSLVQNKDQILQKIKNRFDLDLTSFKDKIQVIYVPGKNMLLPQKKLTMAFHMILPAIYALKCLIKYQPDIFYDTTGFASTLCLTKILLPTTKTVAYVHYPFISLDMIEKVKQRKSDFNNDRSISDSTLRTKLKLLYYQVIFMLYKVNGYFVDFAQTNSSWTHSHMCDIWTNLNSKNKLTKLYPPCSVKNLSKFNKQTNSKEVLMMSLAQFRPQKNHKCQIITMNKIIQHIGNTHIITSASKQLDIQPKLYICGTTRGQDDQKILQQLINFTSQLKLQKHIQFKVNQPFVKIMKYFEQSLIGIHTMEAQHFGISVVEMLAGGLIVVAHNSAGPKQDIIKDQQFLAANQQQYFSKIARILQADSRQKDTWIEQNRVKAEKFGQVAFERNFIRCLQKQLGQKPKQI